MMNEALLQFIWQYSLYKPTELNTAGGERLDIIFPGKLNKDAGPDFLDARIKIGSTVLAGNIELHVNASDWNKHGHQNDPAYKNLVLHVVFNNDLRSSNAGFPVLELGPHIPGYVIERYSTMMKTAQALPCGQQHQHVKSIVKESLISRMLAERWEMKLGEWQELLQQSAGDWRNLLYWRIAANFGFKVNSDAFLALARSLSINILGKHRTNLLQIEALLFGQAGMLDDDFNDEYPLTLQKEYAFLKQKYKLVPLATERWKFLRMRPANFPTVRIAQFAALVHQSLHLFSKILETGTIKEIQPLLDVTASEYWNTHFVLDELTNKSSSKKLGVSSVHNIITNTVAPIQFLYAHQNGLPALQERALQLLDTVPAEENKTIQFWQDNGWKAANATQSQAMLQLYNNYCAKKRCLECSIGLGIIRTA